MFIFYPYTKILISVYYSCGCLLYAAKSDLESEFGVAQAYLFSIVFLSGCEYKYKTCEYEGHQNYMITMA